MKIAVLRLLGIVGVLLFLPPFLLTFSDPHWIEKQGRSFIEWRVQQALFEHVDAVTLRERSSIEGLFGDAANKLRAEAEQQLNFYKQQLKNDIPALIANKLADVQDVSCECRKRWQQRLSQYLTFKIASLEHAKARLQDFAQAKYMSVVSELTADVRIFLATNLFVFAFLLLVSFLKPVAATHLFLPATLLLLSTLICSYFYIFEQNWFYTILYSNYTGFGFIAYLAAVFAVLCDIAFNQAKVTTKIINSALSLVGQVGTFSTC